MVSTKKPQSEIHLIFKIDKKKNVKKRIKKYDNLKCYNPNLQRKSRSLGHLCQNFIRQYSKYPTAIISLDECANQFKVERRRIYDIINILCCFCCLRKKEKNCYYWLGCSQILNYLNLFNLIPPVQASSIIPNLSDDIIISHPLVYTLPLIDFKKRQFRKERSLWMICQEFLLLFASSQLKYLYLDYITRALSSNDPDECNRKTKIRRIYDIANVFQSIGILKKIHNSESKKMYKWEGASGFLSFLNQCSTTPFFEEKFVRSMLEEIKIPTNIENLDNQNYPLIVEQTNLNQISQHYLPESMDFIYPQNISNLIKNSENLDMNCIKILPFSNLYEEEESNKIKKKRSKKETNCHQDFNLLIEAVNQLEHK